MTKIVLNRWDTLLLFKKIYKLNISGHQIGFTVPNGNLTTNVIINYFKDLFGIVPPLIVMDLFRPYQFCDSYFRIIEIDSDTFKIERLK